MDIPKNIQTTIIDVETAYTVEQAKFILARAPDEVKDSVYFALRMILQGPWVVEFFSDRLKSGKGLAEKAIKKNPRALTYFNDDVRKDMDFLLTMIKQNAEVFKYIDVDVKNDTKMLAMMFESNMNIYEFLQDDHKNKVKLFKNIMIKPDGAKQFKHAGPIVRSNQQIVEYIAANEHKMLIHSLWLPKEIVMQIFSRFTYFSHREYFDVYKNMPKELLGDKEVALCIMGRDAELYNILALNMRCDWDIIMIACSRNFCAASTVPEIVINDNEFIMCAFKYFARHCHGHICPGLKSLMYRVDFEEKQELISLLLLQECPNVVGYLTPVNQIQNKKLIINAICQKKCSMVDLCSELRKNIDFICGILDIWNDFNVPCELQNHPSIVKKRLEFGLVAFKKLDALLRNDIDICLIAMKKNGKDLKYVLDHGKSYDVVLAAIENDPGALKFAGYFREYADLVNIAIRKNPKVHRYIGGGLRGDKLFLRTLPETVPILYAASHRLRRAGLNYIWFDDELLNHTQPYLPPEIQQQVLSWII